MHRPYADARDAPVDVRHVIDAHNAGIDGIKQIDIICRP
jgi:hypothetical protein